LPTVITHSLIGTASASMFKTKKYKVRFWLLSVICPMLPDLDVIAFAFGIPYAHFFGHRGFFHSIPFAFLLAVMFVLLFFRDKTFSYMQRTGLIFYFFLLTSTHGLLDAFTSGGLGIALLSPFSAKRFFFPVTPIQVSPLGISAFFSEWGLRVIKSEIFWVWMPLLFIFVLVKLIQYFGKKYISTKRGC
jgi:inner membrane protein